VISPNFLLGKNSQTEKEMIQGTYERIFLMLLTCAGLIIHVTSDVLFLLSVEQDFGPRF
jgi:hypothetical protein